MVLFLDDYFEVGQGEILDTLEAFKI